jgi:hypothetical protein
MKPGMQSAYATSAEVFDTVSRMHTPGLHEQLKSIGKDEIVVVQGTYDHVEKLLDTMGVPYSMVGRNEIGKHNGGRVMLVNCATYGGPVPAVREFVRDGGRVITTDWALSLVEKTFPGRLTKTSQTGDEVVEVEAHTDLAHRFLGMNYVQCHPQWWLEGSSHVYDIGEGVVPIITSEELEAKHGKPYIAAGFVEGAGEVFHFISHMELQRTRQKGKASGEGLEEFLAKMDLGGLDVLDAGASIAELEAAFSSLTTLAHLVSPVPLIGGSMKSTMYGGSKLDVPKSKALV